MNRRELLTSLSSLPFLGWLAPKGDCNLERGMEPEPAIVQYINRYWLSLDMDRPNEYQTAPEFRAELWIHLCTCGKVYVWRVPNGLGTTFEAHIIPTSRVRHESHWGYSVLADNREYSCFIDRNWMDCLTWHDVTEKRAALLPIPLPPKGRIVYR